MSSSATVPAATAVGSSDRPVWTLGVSMVVMATPLVFSSPPLVVLVAAAESIGCLGRRAPEPVVPTQPGRLPGQSGTQPSPAGTMAGRYWRHASSDSGRGSGGGGGGRGGVCGLGADPARRPGDTGGGRQRQGLDLRAAGGQLDRDRRGAGGPAPPQRPWLVAGGRRALPGDPARP